MKNTYLIVIALLTFLSCSAQKKQDYQSFGAKIDDKKTISIKKLVNAAKSENKPFKIRGTVKDVCQMKGCWMTLENGNGIPVRVRFKDYAFFVPKDIHGQEVVVKGVAVKKELSEKMARHYAKDAGVKYDSTASHLEVFVMADGVLVEKNK